jgi:hypothetical protein
VARLRTALLPLARATPDGSQDVRAAPGGRITWSAAKRAVPVLIVSMLVFNATVSFLPSGPLVWKLTASRLLFVAGFVAVVAAGARLRHFRSPLDIPIALLLLAALVSMTHSFSGSASEALVSELALF